MKSRYRLIRRGVRSGAFYCVDTCTGKRTSLQTTDEDSARQLIDAKNQAGRQPALNLQIAKAYLRRRCEGLGIRGITLHSYRYAWAERAKVSGYPERFAQLALGHNIKAVHRAYAKQAQVTVPPLDEYERWHKEGKLIPFANQKSDIVPVASAMNA